MLMNGRKETGRDFQVKNVKYGGVSNVKMTEFFLRPGDTGPNHLFFPDIDGYGTSEQKTIARLQAYRQGRPEYYRAFATYRKALPAEGEPLFFR